MMLRFMLLALAVVWSCEVFAGTPVALTPAQQQAIMDSGTQFGQGILSISAGTINATGAAAGIPNYNAASTGLAPGAAGLTGPATAKQAGCNNYVAPAGTNQVANQQDCDAVNFLTKNPNPKAAYPINPKTDPTILAGKSILDSARNGTAFTPGGGTPGSGDTTIPTGCVTTTNPTPAVTTTETCYLASSANAQTCDKTLSCNVTQPAPISAATVSTCTNASMYLAVWNGSVWKPQFVNTCVPTCPAGTAVAYTVPYTLYPTLGRLPICVAAASCPAGTTAFLALTLATAGGTSGAPTNVCAGSAPVYSCPSGYTLSGTTCIANPSATCTWTDGCTALQAKTL